jgi:hypothetical protein
MRADLVINYRDEDDKGAIVSLVVWRVPRPVSPSEHFFKYRLVYVVGEQRVIGFDNEHGKGDHKHIAGQEMAYMFRGVDQLLDDFFAEVKKWKAES